MPAFPPSFNPSAPPRHASTVHRYPNRDGTNAGSRELRWRQTGPNASWTSMEPTHNLGDQIVVNATASIPKALTVFPDYFVCVPSRAHVRSYDVRSMMSAL